MLDGQLTSVATKGAAMQALIELQERVGILYTISLQASGAVTLHGAGPIQYLHLDSASVPIIEHVPKITVDEWSQVAAGSADGMAAYLKARIEGSSHSEAEAVARDFPRRVEPAKTPV